MIPTEHQEQAKVIQYCKIQKIPVFAIPNGTHLSGNKGQRARQMNSLKAEGLKVGVPDLFFPITNSTYSGLFIEMKRIKGSTTSKEQKQWLLDLNNAGYQAVICKGGAEAIEVIRNYIELS